MNTDDLELKKLRLKRKKQLLFQQAKSISETVSDNTDDQHTNISIPSKVISLNELNFYDYIKFSPVPVFIDYWADWCQPCKHVAPIVEALEVRYRGKMIFAKIDVDSNQKISNQFGISSIPTFHIWFKDKLIYQFTGALPGKKFDQIVSDTIKNL
ncbi:MAG: Thioredoxin [Candidatus Heimdallarchaeota archaeon LC_3]|nr:MAG: Thioredoxin [Candidatus Heimdallarchaeota archaeon LC_3]